MKTLNEYCAISAEEYILSNEDYDTLYAELVSFIAECGPYVSFNRVLSRLSILCPALPVDTAYRLFFNLRLNGFLE